MWLSLSLPPPGHDAEETQEQDEAPQHGAVHGRRAGATPRHRGLLNLVQRAPDLTWTSFPHNSRASGPPSGPGPCRTIIKEILSSRAHVSTSVGAVAQRDLSGIGSVRVRVRVPQSLVWPSPSRQTDTNTALDKRRHPVNLHSVTYFNLTLSSLSSAKVPLVRCGVTYSLRTTRNSEGTHSVATRDLSSLLLTVYVWNPLWLYLNSRCTPLHILSSLIVTSS